MGLESVQEPHRSGSFKQQNKPHKHGRHRSKGALEKERKGRVGVKVLTKRHRREATREERRHRATQLRQAKRDATLAAKRSLGAAHAPPFLAALVPLCGDADPHGALALLRQADPHAAARESPRGLLHVGLPRFKQRLSLVVPPPGDLYAVLDALKVADTVLFVLSAVTPGGLDAQGEALLSACMAQGLPSVVVALAHTESLPPKKRHDAKMQAQKVINNWLPDTKVMLLEKHSDGLNILHRICSQKQQRVVFRDRRPHLMAENAVYEPYEQSSLGTLKVSGYVRGQTLSVNALVHIPGWGDFQMSHIAAPEDPYPLTKPGRDATCDQEMNDEDAKIVAKADPNVQESLVSENVPDPLEAEQTWPTEEELVEAEARRLVKKVPKGMSDYQAAWIPDCEAEEVSGSEEGSEDEMEMAVDAKSESDIGEGCPAEEEEEDVETVTVSEFADDAQRYDEKMDLTEEEETLQKLKDARSHLMFPDEVDTPNDTPARVRFQKYRGLMSFRTSPWDPKENLPLDYAKIFQFENFNRTRKRVFQDLSAQEGALPGWYVTLHIKNVPMNLVEARNPSHPLVVYGMLPHEQKMSVLNIVLKRPNTVSDQTAIKSKEELIFHCGYRRFKFCPIFSQHMNGTKHKYERYFQPDSIVVATVFAPIVFPPCGTLVFKENKDGSQNLVAVGSVLSVNPDRIIAKRVVLSGHPLRVNKKSTVVRFMFFNREDIEWFKKVELKTKYGRRGHIKEPLGTHGHMKCVFDGQLKSQDTISMSLYKRVFPKWTYEPCVDVPLPLYNNLNQDHNMDAVV